MVGLYSLTQSRKNKQAKMRKIVLKYPHKILQTKTKDYDLEQILEKENLKAFQKEVSRLKFAKTLADGVGLAANQIGIENSMFIYNNIVAINPQISWRSKETNLMTEKCLSLEEGVDVYRNNVIVVNYFNLNFDPVELVLSDYDARVFQHEYDHLQGRLIIDYK